MENDTQNYTLL